MVTWVLERDVFSEKCFASMVEHFKSHNIPYHIVRVIPFVHEIEGKVPDIEGPCVVYGSIGTQVLAKKYGWTPGVWTNDLFNEKVIIEKLGKLSLNHGSWSCKLSEVPQLWKLLSFKTLFIKPNTDTKEFAGEVIHHDRFIEWYQNMMKIGYLETDDFEVILSVPKELGMEWRTIIVEGQVVECSIYKQWQRVKSERQMNPEVIRFAEKCAKIHSPADVFVLDVVDTRDGLRVLEYGTFNSAGLYACDVGNIIDAINFFVDKKYQV